jgi:hypothetical protein
VAPIKPMAPQILRIHTDLAIEAQPILTVCRPMQITWGWEEAPLQDLATSHHHQDQLLSILRAQVPNNKPWPFQAWRANKLWPSQSRPTSRKWRLRFLRTSTSLIQKKFKTTSTTMQKAASKCWQN